MKGFSKRYPPNHPGPRYGPAFRAMRDRAKAGYCWVREMGYHGPGHDGCGPGQQMSEPTACHLGRNDADGMLEGCGRAHDLYDGIGGRSTIEAFRAWLAPVLVRHGFPDLKALARYRAQDQDY